MSWGYWTIEGLHAVFAVGVLVLGSLWLPRGMHTLILATTIVSQAAVGGCLISMLANWVDGRGFTTFSIVGAIYRRLSTPLAMLVIASWWATLGVIVARLRAFAAG